ncbi:transcriptional regulator [Corynebacterium diphtheriae]|nr:arsenical resistance operon repressor [Corynebacterium diphtheriae HC02]CAB0531139.1 transcriptional regulator [Corynebacterium diphtheriae]CAB0532568.1 transcriptional regulator [Corynebacterium diphtheriae]CAB0532706.1 transcriptional regulator [Corynebacterium diphtheriae]CAB0540207.1 transcriptional regulator [Corynebacterium diphtheriae]
MVGMTLSQTLPLADLSDCCSLGAGPLTSVEAERYATLFKVLADPARLRLLSQLAADGCGPVSVGELTETSGLSQPTVSHHLKRLTEAGLLDKVRVGRTVTHQVRPELFAELRTVLQMD